MSLKNLLFLISISTSIVAFGQKNSNLLDQISSDFSDNLSDQILIKNTSIRKTCNKKDNINIHVNFLYNSDGIQTNLSKELGYRLTNYLQKDLNDVIIRQVYYKLCSPYDIDMPTNEEIEKTKKNDFTLTGQYIIGRNNIKFSKFTLSHITSNIEYKFEDFTVEVSNVAPLEKLDNNNLIENPLKNLMEFKKENVLVESINLTKSNLEETSTEIDGIGTVYKTQYNTDYNIKLNLAQNSYIYAFFFDPGDKEHEFLWAIENQNTIFKSGEYINFLEYNLNFYETLESGKYSYIKFIFTKEKIDINKYYTKKFIDNYETTIVEKEQCKQLINDIKKLEDVQTKTIILTF